MQELDCRFGLERRVWVELLVRGGPHLASCLVLLGTDGHTTLLWPSCGPPSIPSARSARSGLGSDLQLGWLVSLGRLGLGGGAAGGRRRKRKSQTCRCRDRPDAGGACRRSRMWETIFWETWLLGDWGGPAASCQRTRWDGWVTGVYAGKRSDGGGDGDAERF